MIFGRGKSPNHEFKYNNKKIEVVKDFKYLGVFFSKAGTFNYNNKQQYDKGIKALYSVLSKCKRNHLSISCQMDLFDKIIQPILLYGCEIWGFSNTSLLEKLHLKFCKHILYANNRTPNAMVYGELGRFPLIINIKVRMISFWSKLHFSYDNKISTLLYQLVRNQSLPWINCIKNILNE